VREAFKISKASTFAWFLICSYAYHIKNNPLMSDEAFNKLCKFLLDNYVNLEHNLKNLVTYDMLKANSAKNLSIADYPKTIKWLADCESHELDLKRNIHVKTLQSDKTAT
jgi:hypothetical protein